VLARLPLGVDRLAALLLIRGVHESYALAGAAAGASVLGIGIGNPLQGRLAARSAAGRVLIVFAGLHAVAVGLFVVLVLAGAAPITQLLGAFALGACYPAIGATIRSAIPRLLESRGSLQTTAYALEATAMEFVGISAPLLIALAVGLASAAWALIFAAILMFFCTCAFVRSVPPECLRRTARADDGDKTGGALAVLALLTVQFTMGFGVAAMSVAIVGFATAMSAPALSGVLLAVDALASLVGGLVYAARASERSATALYLPLLAAWSVATTALTIARSPWTMALLLVCTGVVFAAMAASVTQAIGALVTAKSSMEIFTWMITSWTIGGTVGAVVAGQLTQIGGWRTTLLVTGAAIAASTGFAWLARPGGQPTVALGEPS
jgi:MFS family permease